MSYIAVGQVHGGDVEDMLIFCNLISQEKTPYHAHFLEQKLLKMAQLWPVYLPPREITRLLESAYRKAFRKHEKLRSIGPIPNRIQYLSSKVLRYRPNNLSTIITLDMARCPALLSIQGYFPDIVQEYAKKACIGHIISVENNKVLFPSEVLDLQFSLGTVLQLLGR